MPHKYTYGGIKVKQLKEQGLELIPQIQEEWKHVPFKLKKGIDETAANKQLSWLLPACELRNIQVIWFDSPVKFINYLGALYAYQRIRNTNINSSNRKMRNFIWQDVKSAAWMNTLKFVNKGVWSLVWKTLRLEMEEHMKTHLYTPLTKHLEDAFARHTRKTCGELLPIGERHKIRTFWKNLNFLGLLTDTHWVAFYDFFVKLGVMDVKSFNRYKMLLQSGVFMITTIDDVCCVIKSPYRISRNNAGKLHNERWSALAWGDGYELYFWNGIRVDARLIEKPDTITKEDILKEKNAEVRRCILEKLGVERYAELLGIEPIDSGTDFQGNQQVLFKTKERDALARDYLYFVKVICPSTSRNYFLSVPEMNTVQEAVAWTFGKNQKTYKPKIET